MPNKITNYLTIKGDMEKINTIIGSDFLLKNTIIDPSEEYKEEWCIDNWGTLTDVIDVSINQEEIDSDQDENDPEIIIIFDTLVSPPNKWLESICKIYKQLIFINNWVTEDLPICGQTICNDGEYIEEIYEDEIEALYFLQENMPEYYSMFKKMLNEDTESIDLKSESIDFETESDELSDFD